MIFQTFHALTNYVKEENLDKIQNFVISSNAACHIKVKDPNDIDIIVEDLKSFEAVDVYKKV